MERKTVGYKVEYSTAIFILMILGGLAAIIGGVVVYTIIQGAIGGGLGGACIGAGACLFMMPIMSKSLPKDLVTMDDTTVYLPKVAVQLNQIQNVEAKGKAIIISPTNGKRVVQSFVANAPDCVQQIRDAMSQK